MLTKHIVTSSALFCDFLCRRLSHCWYDAPTTSYASVGRIYTNMSFVFKYIHEEAEAYTRFCSQISHYPVLDASCDRVAHRLLESNQATYIHHNFFTLIKSRNFSKVSNFTFKKSLKCLRTDSVPQRFHLRLGIHNPHNLFLIWSMHNTGTKWLPLSVIFSSNA